MKINEISFLERVKTAEYAFKEIKMGAVLDESDDALACINTLESMVKRQLSGKVVVDVQTRETAPQATTATSNTPSEKNTTPSTVGTSSPDNSGSEGVAINGAIEKAKELGGVEKLKPTKDQLKKIATHLGLTFKSKDTNADLIGMINIELIGAVDPAAVPDLPVVVEAHTLEDVQNALRDVAIHFKNPAKAVAILGEFNVAAAAALPIDQYGALIKRAKLVIS